MTKKIDYRFFYCFATDEILLFESGWSKKGMTFGIFLLLKENLLNAYFWSLIIFGIFVVSSIFSEKLYFMLFLLPGLHCYIADTVNKEIMDKTISCWKKDNPGLELSYNGYIQAASLDDALKQAKESANQEKQFMELLAKQDISVQNEVIRFLDDL